PLVERVASVDALRERFASEAYGPDEPLVRAAAGIDEPGLLLAAHHGAVDGIGLLALLSAALAQRVHTKSPGGGDRAATSSFLAGAARRMAEAAFAPPTRLWPPPRSSGAGRFARAGFASAKTAPAGDALAAARLAHARIGTAALTAAAGSVTAWWN